MEYSQGKDCEWPRKPKDGDNHAAGDGGSSGHRTAAAGDAGGAEGEAGTCPEGRAGGKAAEAAEAAGNEDSPAVGHSMAKV